MPDRENVMYNIERCIYHVPDACRDCSYCGYSVDDLVGCMEKLLSDALELLKEQEAIPIIHEYRDTDLKIVQCGNCLAQLPFEKQKYCAECGNKIDWSILAEREEGR